MLAQLKTYWTALVAVIFIIALVFGGVQTYRLQGLQADLSDSQRDLQTQTELAKQAQKQIDALSAASSLKAEQAAIRTAHKAQAEETLNDALQKNDAWAGTHAPDAVTDSLCKLARCTQPDP